MRKFFGCVILTFIFMFAGMISADAGSSFEKVGDNYKFSWDGLTDMEHVTYTLSCTGGSSVESSGGNNNGSVTSSNGYVVLKPSENSLTCKITNSNGAVVEQKSVSTSTGGGTTSKQNTTTTTTTTTTVPRSSNANLASINITTNDDEAVTLSPSFSANVYTYQANVASTVRTVNVDARLEDSRANMIVNGADDELVAGENNEITITVTAEDGTKKAYTINITREALTADATLSDLTIEECEDFEFQEDKFTYNVKIGRNVDSLTLEYTLSDENATVEIDGNENLKNGSKVRITVTAEDGTKRVYTLNIQKETTTTKKNNTVTVEDKNPLIIMGLSVIAFGFVGGIIYVIKR